MNNKLELHINADPAYENVAPIAIDGCTNNDDLIATISRRPGALAVFRGILADRYQWTVTDHHIVDHLGVEISTAITKPLAVKLVGRHGYTN